MRKIIIVVAAALAIATGVACGAKPNVTSGSGQGQTQQPAGQQGPKKFAIGEHAQITLANGATEDIVVNSFKAQGGILVANVTIQCTSGSVDYNPFDWSATAGDSTKLDIDPGFDVRNLLHSGTLAAGQKISGNLAFKGTAEQLNGASVTYTAGITTMAYWVVIAPAPTPDR